MVWPCRKFITANLIFQDLTPFAFKTPLLVSPVYHYQNGGLEIDENGKTTLTGLWAAGEVTVGIHGKNRLGGNALTDALVFGRRTSLNSLLSL